MTNIYLVRHGSTKLNGSSANSVDKIRGWSDVPLDKLGREEANKVGKELKSIKKVRAIISSDLKRAEETADTISKYLKITPKYVKELRPWDLGEFTGKSSKDSMPEIRKYVDDTPSKAVPKGESFDSFKKRAFKGINTILRDYPNDNVIIVTHHRVERLLKAWIKEGKPTNHTVDLNTFTQKGEPPGSYELIKLEAPNKDSSLKNTIKDSIKEVGANTNG